MNARSKVLVSAMAAACALALVGCSAQPASSSAGSNASSSSSSVTASSSVSISSSSASVAASEGNVVIDLDYSAGTGYEWTYEADPEGIVELTDQTTESLSQDEAITGGGLEDHFTFRAVQPGEVVLTFDLVRNWELDEPPAETQTYAFTVTDDLQMILNPYKSDFDNEPTIGSTS